MRTNFKKNVKNVVCGLLGLVVFLLFLCGCNKDVGSLYSLREVYEAGEITRGDLLNIAYHSDDEKWNEEAMRDFTPQPIDVLNEKTLQKIKETIAEKYRNDTSNVRYKDITAKNIFIVEYLGCYNGYYAFRYRPPAKVYILENYIQLEDEVEEVGGVTFKHIFSTGIYLWKENGRGEVNV